MATSTDLATALDHVLGDPNTEAKFQALKTLHSKKIKSLMNSIDLKEREIDKQKVLNKDNRRTEIIQSLKKKLKHHELVINVLKDELIKQTDMSYEEVNQFVIGKTISGPKRFRPLTREELENQITELERKLELERKMRTKLTSNVSSSGGSVVSKTSITKQKKQNGVMNNVNDENMKGNVKEDDLRQMIDISDLQDQIIALNHEISSRDDVISKQKDEIFRLRSSNATMHRLEEEIDNLDRSYKELTVIHQRAVEDLEDSLHQLSASQEEKFQIQANVEQDLEQANLEIDSLREECQKGLKQNAHLLRLMANMESKASTKVVTSSPSRDVSPSKTRNTSDVENTRLKEKLKAANAQISELERGISSSDAALLSLKETLREKNETIRELKRNIAELTRRNANVNANPSDKIGTNDDMPHAESKSSGRGTLTPRDSKSAKSSPRSPRA